MKGIEMEINKIYNENCLDTMSRMEDNFVDLTVTSPPYDNLRDYKNGIGEKWDFETFKPIAKELYRVTKEGGVVVWVVGDATIDGSETGTSFKQALYFKEVGFNLHDTMIYRKKNPVPYHHNRYNPAFEYMFVLSKGKPKTFNGLRVPRKTKGVSRKSTFRQPNGDLKPANTMSETTDKLSDNVWDVATNVGTKGHPAPFPQKLAQDHIKSWSNPKDLVYDPFAGSGTTAKMAMLNGRKYIGSEISEEYCDIIEKRLRQKPLFGDNK